MPSIGRLNCTNPLPLKPEAVNKKKPVPNPHDAFFRRTLGREAVAREFLRHYLPAPVSARLDLQTVALEDASFVDEALREHVSDLLYRVGLREGGTAFVYVLLEHKSVPDERVALQVLRYLAQAWDRLPAPLPLIVPVVIYHGAQPWRVGRHLRDLFGPNTQDDIWRRFLPDFEYHLCDLTKYADEELRGGLGLGAALKLLKHIFGQRLRAKLPDIFRELAEELPEQEVIAQLETMLHYLAASRRIATPQIREALYEVDKPGGRMITVLDELRQEGRLQGLQQGRQEGRQEGLREGATELTLQLLRAKLGRLDLATKERVQALAYPQLKQLTKALLQFESRADLEKWLRRHAAPATKS